MRKKVRERGRTIFGIVDLEGEQFHPRRESAHATSGVRTCMCPGQCQGFPWAGLTPPLGGGPAQEPPGSSPDSMGWGQPAGFSPGSSLFCSRRSDPPPLYPRPGVGGGALTKAPVGGCSCGGGCDRFASAIQSPETRGFWSPSIPPPSSTGGCSVVIMFSPRQPPSVSRRACPPAGPLRDGDRRAPVHAARRHRQPAHGDGAVRAATHVRRFNRREGSAGIGVYAAGPMEGKCRKWGYMVHAVVLMATTGKHGGGVGSYEGGGNCDDATPVITMTPRTFVASKSKVNSNRRLEFHHGWRSRRIRLSPACASVQRPPGEPEHFGPRRPGPSLTPGQPIFIGFCYPHDRLIDWYHPQLGVSQRARFDGKTWE